MKEVRDAPSIILKRVQLMSHRVTTERAGANRLEELRMKAALQERCAALRNCCSIGILGFVVFSARFVYT